MKPFYVQQGQAGRSNLMVAHVDYFDSVFSQPPPKAPSCLMLQVLVAESPSEWFQGRNSRPPFKPEFCCLAEFVFDRLGRYLRSLVVIRTLIRGCPLL